MKFIKIFSVFLVVICIVTSCKKFVQVDFPKSQLVRSAVFNDLTTANSAMIQIYVGLRERIVNSNSGIADLTRLVGFYGDELHYWGSMGSNINLDMIAANNLVASNQHIGAIWDNSYFLIYSANSIIEGLESSNSQNISETDRNRLTGEALFLRSFVHFYLTNLFGSIPYVETTDYLKNNQLHRTPTAELYEQLVLDLKKAILLLPEAYSSSDRVRPNASVARAMLARVYLYQENWKDALEMANMIISDPQFHLLTDLDQIFIKDSKETLWQLSPSTSTGITPEAQYYLMVSAPPPLASLSEAFVSAYSPIDQRLLKWIGEIQDSQNRTYYYANKYKRRVATTPQNEFSIQFRLAELYLIRAEAKAQLLDFDGAIGDVQQIRSRAGLPMLNKTDKESLLKAILEERNRELFLEYPHRFFDLKRTGNSTILEQNKAGWNESDKLWPIPEAELLINPNLLPQNPKY